MEPTKAKAKAGRKPAAAVDSNGGEEAASAAASPQQQLVVRLGNSRVNNIFTHLRKLALHPLLVRQRYTDEQVGGWMAGGWMDGWVGG